MKYLFLAIFLGLVGLSAVAWMMTPRADASGKKTIVWATDDNPRRRQQIALFNQLHPEYDLRIDPQSGGLQKVVTQSLARVGPDVFDGNISQLSVLRDAGLLYDATDALKARGVTLDQVWPLGQKAISIDGRVFAYPCNVGTDAIWFHKDVFEAEGVPFPPDSNWRWEDFLETAQRLTKRDAGGRPLRFGILGLNWQDLMYSNGGRIFTPDGRKCVLDSPQAIDGLQKWLDLQLKYRVMPSPVEAASLSTQGGWGSGTITLFKDKRAAMAAGGRWWLCMLRDMKDAEGRFPLNLGVAEKPLTKYRRFVGYSRVAFVNATSKHPERGVEFLAFLAGNEYSDQINRDADALPGRISASDRPAYNHDPNAGRDGGSSPAWKRLTGDGICSEESPYISSTQVWLAINRQVDLARNGVKNAEEALRQATIDVNEEIQRAISRDPGLRARYDNGDTRPVFGNVPDTPPQAAAPVPAEAR